CIERTAPKQIAIPVMKPRHHHPNAPIDQTSHPDDLPDLALVVQYEHPLTNSLLHRAQPRSNRREPWDAARSGVSPKKRALGPAGRRTAASPGGAPLPFGGERILPRRGVLDGDADKGAVGTEAARRGPA